MIYKDPVLILIYVHIDAYIMTTTGPTTQKGTVDPEITQPGNYFHAYSTNSDNDVAVCVELTTAMPVVTQSKHELWTGCIPIWCDVLSIPITAVVRG